MERPAHSSQDPAGPLAGAAVWTGDSLPADAGRLRLDEECRAELDRAVAALRANPLPTLVLHPDDFELAACRALMARATSTLDDGVGFVIVDRLPLEALDRGEAIALYWLLARMIARPVAQKWDGKVVYDVFDTGQPAGNGVRPDQTNIEQNFHTDNSYNLCPPHYVSLLCLQTAMRGGISGIVSFHAAYNEMRRRHPDLLERLHRPFYFDRQREHAPGDVMVTHHPMFEYDGARMIARLSKRQVVHGQRLAGEALDGEGAAALEAFEGIFERARHGRGVHLRTGANPGAQ